MSVYYTMHGEINYEDQAAYDAAIALLKDNGYMDERGFFLNEDDEPLTEEPNAFPEPRCIDIPYGYYRNLGQLLQDLFKGGTGLVVWTSTDGMFQGGIYTQNGEEEVDLEEWAKDSFFDEGEHMPDPDNDFDAYCQVEAEIEAAFHEDHGG